MNRGGDRLNQSEDGQQHRHNPSIYPIQSQGVMSTPGSNQYAQNSVNMTQYRQQNLTNYQPTLGEMADQFQERARAEAKVSQPKPVTSRVVDLANQVYNNSAAAGAEEYYGYGGGDGDDYDGDDNDGGFDGDDDPALISAGNESTGRWTRPEHELFLQALKKYGKEWKKVAGMVKTRTVVQTRTHAQKYFQKLTKSGGPGSGGGGSHGHGHSSGGRSESASASSGPASAASAIAGGSGTKNAGLFYHKQSKQRGGKGDGGAMLHGSPPLSQLHSMGDPSSAGMSMSGMHPSMLLGGGAGMLPQHLMNSYIPTTQGYGEIDAQDYYDSMDVVALMGELQKQQTSPMGMMHTPMSLGMPNINTNTVGPPDFPEPSPAACGKRKHAELQAAQMLAESSASKSRPAAAGSESGGGNGAGYRYSSFANSLGDGGPGSKQENGSQSSLVRDTSSGSVAGAGSSYNSRRNRMGLTLSIVDPNEGGNLSSMDPGTPWEAAIQHLEQQSSSTAPMSRLMRSNSFSNYTMPAVPVSTPSEQRNFINKVRALVKDADLAGFASLLGAAEYSAQSVVKEEDDESPAGSAVPHMTPVTAAASEECAAEGENGGGAPNNTGKASSRMSEQAPVSNLMSVFTPDAGATGRPSTGSEGSLPEPVTPETAQRRQEEAKNTQMNSSNNGFSASPRGRPSASLVARSLNRIDRNARSVLMDIAATSDPAINQTLLYSMCMLLIEHGATPGLADGLGCTALHYAAAQGHERIGRLLLTKGCPLNLQNADGDTATHIAARHGHVAFIEMLADLGANFHIRNGVSMCALDLIGSNTKDMHQRDHLRKLMLTAEPRLRTLVLTHEDFQEHTARRPSDWEGPDRLEVIMKRLRDRGEFPEHELEISNRFEKADVELLGRVHSPEYIAFVNMLSKQVQQEAVEGDGAGGAAKAVLPFTPQVQRFVRRQHSEELKSSESCDTSFSVGTLSAARRAAGAVAHAVDRVMLGRNRNVFCAVRPPGHHAGYRGLLDGANSCGFCIFNNVAAGALHALVEHHCERVAIIDLDVHHGNGTEDIVRRYAHPSRLFFFSLHLYDKDDSSHTAAAAVKTTTDRPIDAATAPASDAPAPRSYEFYPGTGVKDDHIHNIINVPLTPLWAVEPARTSGSAGDASGATKASVVSPGQFVGREGYRQAIEQRLIPSLRAFNPTLILLSIGFDAAAGDVGNCRQFPGEVGSRMGIDLQPEDFAWATTEVMKIADICCGGRLVSVLEGGYGEYAVPAPGKPAGPAHVPTTRGASRHGSAPAPTAEPAKPVSAMNRGLLGKVAAAHVHRLMDPYGPTSLGTSAPPHP